MISRAGFSVPGREALADTFSAARIDTPAYIYDLRLLLATLRLTRSVADEADCELLYSLKANSILPIVEVIRNFVDGYSCSSAFECRFAERIRLDGQSIHFTSPVIKQEHIKTLARACDFVSFNSLAQFEAFRVRLDDAASLGIRLNPMKSFVRDERYDPCRPDSKLGVRLTQLNAGLAGLSGIQVHSNCDSVDFSDLQETIEVLGNIQGIKPSMWMNLGGGYLFWESKNRSKLRDIVAQVRASGFQRVFIEPGAGIVRRSGFIVSEVVDMIQTENKRVAVLDTTVNHWPEVFEYQFEPDVLGHDETAPYNYVLAGGSCLPGDVFGDYSFNLPLRVGSRIAIANAGAYSFAKASFFNGMNLPSVFVINENDEIEEVHRLSFNDYLRHCGGVSPNARV